MKSYYTPTIVSQVHTSGILPTQTTVALHISQKSQGNTLVQLQARTKRKKRTKKEKRSVE